MKTARVGIAFLFATCLAVLAACGGGNGGEGTPSATSYVILEADISTLPSGVDAEEAMENAERIIERRRIVFGARVSDAERRGTSRLVVQLSGPTAEEARALIGRAVGFEFREPERDETGENFVCTGATGETLTVPADVVETADGSLRPTNLTPSVDDPQWHCVPTGSTVPTGMVNWVPATGIGSDGQEKALTSRFLRGEETEVIFDSAGRPFVQISFNSEGGDLFEQITSRLLGLPVGIFLDDELISAPTVQGVLSYDAVVTGLELDEAETLARQLRAGALPVPVRVIDAGEGSLP